jgi:nucleotide-binding universal stress UspA family protein
MSFANILVPMTAEAGDEDALHLAFALAAPFGATVTALFARGDARAVANAKDLRQTVGERVERHAAEEDAARKLFEQEAGRAGAAATHWLAADGALDDAALAEARFADAIVFGPVGEARMRRDAFLKTLMQAARPVLIAPQGAKLDLSGRIAIGWDGEFAAARALTAAVPVLKLAAAVDLITIGALDAGKIAASEAASYLALHGVRAKARDVPPAGPAGQALLAAARAEGASLLVMGAYGHSRLVETLLGGATAHMVAHAAMPVLIMH